MQPEKSWRQLDPAHMAHAFAINAIGPALLMKHFLPLLPGEGRSVFATLSAKVGSIGDNALGGWYSYRASKAALNQLVRTAAIELRRRQPMAVCVALHPGTVGAFRQDGTGLADAARLRCADAGRAAWPRRDAQRGLLQPSRGVAAVVSGAGTGQKYKPVQTFRLEEWMIGVINLELRSMGFGTPGAQ
mgnify:CR=1 FL=1